MLRCFHLILVSDTRLAVAMPTLPLILQPTNHTPPFFRCRKLSHHPHTWVHTSGQGVSPGGCLEAFTRVSVARSRVSAPEYMHTHTPPPHTHTHTHTHTTHTHTHLLYSLYYRFRPVHSQPPRPVWHRNHKRRYTEEQKFAESQEIIASIKGTYPQPVIDCMSKLDMEELNYDLLVAVIRYISLQMKVSGWVWHGCVCRYDCSFLMLFTVLVCLDNS